MYTLKNDTSNEKLILSVGKEIIGYLDYIYRIEEKTLELLHLFVNFDFRHKKFSSILIKEIINYAQKINAKFITLNIDPELEDCYDTITKENDIKSDYYASFIELDEDEREIIMRKAKKLQEARKYLLIHLFEKFNFKPWIEEYGEQMIKEHTSKGLWFILWLC